MLNDEIDTEMHRFSIRDHLGEQEARVARAEHE